MPNEMEASINEPDYSSKSRTYEEIDQVFEDAHVESNTLKPVYQTLWFAEEQPLEENLFLLELDKKLLSVLKEGQSFVLRGDQEERAVMCTDNQTFTFQVAEISNSLAVVPDIVWPANANGSQGRVVQDKRIEKVLFEYFEVQPTYPKLSKLMSLLESSSYKGPKYEEVHRKNGVEFKSTRDLLQRVQASEGELLQALQDKCICFLNGHWRVLDRDYHHNLLSCLLKIIADKSWSLDRVIKEEAVELLRKEFPSEDEDIINHLMEWYCEKTDCSDEDDETILVLRTDRVCRFLGEVLLRLAAKFNFEEFMKAWQETVPKGMNVDLKYLDGIALKDDQTKPPSIYFFPEWELPEDISERFRVLFSTKQKWLLNEIQPYVQNLTTERMNVNALLTKHALGSHSGGQRCYSARHGN